MSCNKVLNATKKQKIKCLLNTLMKLYHLSLTTHIKTDIKIIKYKLRFQKINKNTTKDEKIKTLVYMYLAIKVIKNKLNYINDLISRRNVKIDAILITKHKKIILKYSKKK